MEGPITMSEAIQPPTIRIRISHDKTAKGWRCNETTVEITLTPKPTDGIYATAHDFSLWIGPLLQQAHDDGLAETQRRNGIEGFST